MILLGLALTNAACIGIAAGVAIPAAFIAIYIENKIKKNKEKKGNNE